MNPLDRRLPWAARRLLYDSIGFVPLPAQERALSDTDVPFLAFAGGVGAGKSFTAAKYLLPEVIPNYMRAALLKGAGIDCHYRGKQDETRRYFWLAGPDYTLCRREFDLLVQDLAGIGRGGRRPEHAAGRAVVAQDQRLEDGGGNQVGLTARFLPL